jgi:hypothetical protein
VVPPFCDQPPRPEYIATREHVEIIKPQRADLESYRGELQAV